jgi:hypothetical protein
MNHNTINSVIQLNKNMETENKGCTHTSQVHEHIDGDGVGCSSCDELGMLYIFNCTININFSQWQLQIEEQILFWTAEMSAQLRMENIRHDTYDERDIEASEKGITIRNKSFSYEWYPLGKQIL